MGWTWRRLRGWSLLLPLLLLLACRDGGQQTPLAENGGTPEAVSSGATAGNGVQEEPEATPFILPTLLPTHTRAAGATEPPPETPTPRPSPESTMDFEQPVLELRYRIPALQLDRRLEGNVSGQITVVDETKGVASIRQNQGGVLLELQEFLPNLELEPAPEGCETCVLFSYSMPIAATDGEGWLQDPVLLASVENYTSALLGPHFPPGTVLGLRRSATSYDVAHSLALSADGLLYRWLATEGEIEEAADANSVAPELSALLADLDAEALQEQYAVDCRSTPVETLYLNHREPVESSESEAEEGQWVRIICPAFSLPRSLLPLYVQLDGLLGETLAGSGLPRPPSEVALGTLIDYRREDGAHVEIALDGTANVTAAAGEAITTTLASSETMSITAALMDSGLLQPGLQVFAEGELANIVLVRGEQGMLEVAWPAGETPQAIAEAIALLDSLIEVENGN